MALITVKNELGETVERHQSETTGLTHGLGRNPMNDAGKKKRANMKSFTQFLSERGLSPIPRNEWKSFNRRRDSVFSKDFINNQGSTRGCVGWSGAGAETDLRFLQGFGFQKLSGGFIYAHINGGRDSGAMIIDAQEALQQFGTCLESEFNGIYLRQISAQAIASAKRFIEVESVKMDTFDDLCNAIQMGAMVQYPINVANNYENFTSEGVAGASSGGNHSVRGRDIEQLASGEWVLWQPNSWGTAWGPFRDGTCLINEKMISMNDGDSDAFAHFACMTDPQEPLPVPVV